MKWGHLGLWHFDPEPLTRLHKVEGSCLMTGKWWPCNFPKHVANPTLRRSQTPCTLKQGGPKQPNGPDGKLCTISAASPKFQARSAKQRISLAVSPNPTSCDEVGQRPQHCGRVQKATNKITVYPGVVTFKQSPQTLESLTLTPEPTNAISSP